MSKNNCFQKKLKHREIVIDHFFVSLINYLNDKETVIIILIIKYY